MKHILIDSVRFYLVREQVKSFTTGTLWMNRNLVVSHDVAEHIEGLRIHIIDKLREEKSNEDSRRIDQR